MKRAAHVITIRRTLALALLAVLASSPQPVHSQTTAQPATPMRMIGTVRAVETKTRMIEVITGVGHSVRVVRFQIAEECRITVPWAADHLSSFIPGTRARIEYVAAPAGARVPAYDLVVTLEALAVENSEGAR